MHEQVFELDPSTLATRQLYDVLPVDGRAFMYEEWTSPDWVMLLGPETDQLILIDTDTGQVYDETINTADRPDG